MESLKSVLRFRGFEIRTNIMDHKTYKKLKNKIKVGLKTILMSILTKGKNTNKGVLHAHTP